ncbi:MAG TPA: PAS domain S-box protein [Phenylobacterium sp.]|uniref:PAS domain-containing protein n=1 Tax=Phenylobacterium sp. TaxID=1871053 RepID=UPI002BA323A0|nr:PAS domain S-box protein [Phenylobacterium sp.]HSV03978.1 PAS domain S-box protein [Phenylobacterium sp.]
MDAAQISEALLHTPAEAVVASDRDGNIGWWSPGAERIFGFTAAEALGASLDLIIPEPLRARHWDGFRQVMATGVSRYGAGELLAVPAIRKDGTRISVEFTITPMLDADGAMLGMVAVMRDVTARFLEVRELRRQLAAAAPDR